MENDFEKQTNTTFSEPNFVMSEIPSQGDKKENGTKKNTKRMISMVLIIVVVSAASGFGGAAIGLKTLPGLMGNAANTPITISPTDEDVDLATAIAEKNMQSVVGIKTDVVTNSFFGQTINQGVGTGVIVDSKGYILTNSHVIEDGNAEKITVDLIGGKQEEATLLWNDTLLDLAIVKINATDLVAAELGDSDEIKIGAAAFAIGNPLGLTFERTITDGIISGLNRSIAISENQTIEGLMQTNASINPGNSGGPLLNKKGQVIGITTAKVQSAEGLGFAVPINTAKPILEQIIEKGSFQKSYMGVSGIDVATYLKYYDEDLGTKTGAYIVELYANSPASIAGLQKGDIIVGLNGTKIESMTQMIRKLYEFRPGDKINLEIIRNKQSKTIELTLTSQGGSVG